METEENGIKSLSIKVAREKDKTSTNKIHIDVTVLTIFENLFIDEFSGEDISNLKVEDKKDTLNVLKLNVNLIPKNDIVLAEKLEKHIKHIEIIKNKNKGIDFEYDNDENSVFVVEAKIKDIKPKGTKRKVITYEDSDEIDEGIG